jgi:hypothetical protein
MTARGQVVMLKFNFSESCDLEKSVRNLNVHAALRCSTLLYAALRCSTLLYAALLYAALRLSTLLYAALRCSTLLDAALRCSTLLYAVLRCSTFICSYAYVNATFGRRDVYIMHVMALQSLLYSMKFVCVWGWNLVKVRYFHPYRHVVVVPGSAPFLKWFADRKSSCSSEFTAWVGPSSAAGRFDWLSCLLYLVILSGIRVWSTSWWGTCLPKSACKKKRM